MVNSDTIYETSGRGGYFHERDEFGFLYMSVLTVMNNHKIFKIFKKFIKKNFKKIFNNFFQNFFKKFFNNFQKNIFQSKKNVFSKYFLQHVPNSLKYSCCEQQPENRSCLIQFRHFNIPKKLGMNFFPVTVWNHLFPYHPKKITPPSKILSPFGEIGWWSLLWNLLYHPLKLQLQHNNAMEAML